MREWIRRLDYLLHRRRLEQELANEMQAHREMAVSQGGMPFGNTLRLREQARDVWGWTWLEGLVQDLRYAGRQMRQSPGFTSTAVLMLALGIGVNVAAFGFFNLLVLRPLPIKEPETLLRFDRQSPRNFSDNFSHAEVAFFGAHAKTLSVLAAGGSRVTLERDSKPLDASFVTANYFDELGAKPKLGRLLKEERDGLPTAEPVAVLSQGLWERRFGADPLLIGKVIRLNNKPVTVVGIVSSRFSGLGLGTPDFWVPITQAPYLRDGLSLADFSDAGMGVQMWGRLRGGAGARAAEEELASLAAQLRNGHPKEIWEKESLPSQPGGYAVRVRGEMYAPLALAGALCLLILAAACTTVGSLQLARGASRKREVGIRIAIGAGRGRLLRQFFTESLALAFIGSVAGLAFGYLALCLLMNWSASPAWLTPTPDWRVIMFATGTGWAAAILFGLAPAWQVARGRQHATKIRQALIGAQVAASCTLLIVAALLVRALNHAISAPTGFAYEHVLSIDPNFQSYSPGRARAYFDALRSRLKRIPGVESVSLVSNPPLGHRWTVERTSVGGRPANIHFNNVDPEFFQTMEIPLLRGRNLAPGDRREVVISESLARFEWPSEDPIGKQLRVGPDAFGNFTRDTVVGVSANARLVSPEDSDAVEVYRLAHEDLLPSVVVMVRATASAEKLSPFVSATAKSIDPKLFPEIDFLKSDYQAKIQQAAYAALSVGLLGCLALILACVGIIGLVAYSVAQRTKEIGIRTALGATPKHALAIVLSQFAGPLLFGLLAGIGGAAALSRILRGELYGVGGLDPMAYLTAISLFSVGCACAALLPARRVLRVDPSRALRYE